MITGYHIVDELGTAAGARLFRALRLADQAPVLLKLLEPETPTPAQVARFRQEYELLQSLDVPGVIKPVAFLAEHGRPAMVGEDFAGQPLEVVLRRHRLDVRSGLRLARALAETLAGLHTADLIHRDVRPAHMLVAPDAGRVCLIDLSRAIHRERGAVSPAQANTRAEGDWAYLSPEQTGRMNRSVDYRTDFYSLGVTFYQMFTGTLPFEAADPLEWVHCHVARLPRPPRELVPELPRVVSDIVLKLLAKVPEERYQSAHGLHADLDECLAQWEATGRVVPFVLGTHDVADHFQIPQTLYGREVEVEALRAAFDRVAHSGQPELVLVSGYAGIGKSALVHELHQPIVRQRGSFITGKFDQYRRDIPYATIIEAFRGQVQQLLTESEARIAVWKQELQEALGSNGQLIIDLIPQVELIVGPQPPVPALPPAEAQHRFQMVFQDFVGVFTRPEHPLVLFLDDLQWVDTAGLTLIAYLLTHSDTRSLLLIGAYRENEVSPAHPLMLTLDEMRKTGARVQTIALGPLSRKHLNQLIATTLHCATRRSASLTELVYEKTQGNPFFFIQFLATLHREGLVVYDRERASWTWDITRIRAKCFTDNVAELMVGALQRLPVATQQALQLAGCLGNTFELRILAMISGRSPDDAEADLWEAAHQGLLLRRNGTYTFLHDRVQEAAYALIPVERRATVHLQIGRLLLAHTPADAIDEHIFDVVNHYNQGAGSIIDQYERAQVVALNLQAGRRARASAAYASAGAYFAAGMSLLSVDSWATHYELTHALSVGRAECAYLNGDFDEAERLCDSVLGHARTSTDQVRSYLLKIDLNATRGEFARALASGVECLRLLGIDLPANPTTEQVRAEEQLVWELLGKRQIEDLIDLPPMTNPEMAAALDVLSVMHPPSHFVDDDRLFLIIPAYMTNISLRHGNAPASAMGYATFATIIGHQFGKYREAYRFGKLACDLVDRTQALAYRSKVLFLMGGCITAYSQPLASSLEYLDRCLEAALETGDVPFACYSGLVKMAFLLMKGINLDEVYYGTEKCLTFARQVKFGLVADDIVSLQRLVQALRGQTVHLGSFDNATFSEEAFAAQLRIPHTFCWYQVCKLQARFFAGDYVAALQAADELKERLWVIFGEPVVLEYYFYSALTLMALYTQAPAAQGEFVHILGKQLQQLKVWADNCPENFLNRYALVSAEVARVEGRDLDAMALYEQAIRSAGENGSVQHQGLAYELASAFYRSRGFELFADTYLREARACYVRWGADGKVKQLDAAYPQLKAQPSLASTTSLGAGVEQLDALAVVKASQAISGQIVLGQLLDTLMCTVLESAGAQLGYLLLAQEDGLSLAAEARVVQHTVNVHIHQGQEPAELPLPASLLNYVRRSRESVILADAGQPNPFSADGYLSQQRPKSVLCLPILRQAELIGLFYLENNLITHAFTPDRLAVLEVLASQAAISLESARLYTELQHENTQRKRAEAAVHLLADAGMALVSSLDYENTLAQVANLAVPVLADWCLVDLQGPDGAVRRVASHHVNPAREAPLHELERRYPPDPAAPIGVPLVLRTGQPTFTPDVTDAQLATWARDAEHLGLLQALGLRSQMCVPLIASGRTLGAISFLRGEAGRRYTPADLELAEELARRAAVAIENARLYEAAQQAHRAAERAANRTARLQAITAALSEALTRERVVTVIVEQGMAALGGSTGSVGVLTEAGDALEIIETVGLPPVWVAHWRRIPLDLPVPMAEAVRTGELLLTASRAERDHRFPPRPGPVTDNEAVAFIPLAVEGRTIGTLVVGFAEERTFSQEDRAFLLALAQLCAQALERARLQHEATVAAAAREADRLKTELLNTVSHELRTPLAAIKGFATTLALFGEQLSADEQREFLGEIDGAADRLQELVDNLLHLSRLESGTLGMERAPVALDAVLTRVVEQARQRHPDRAIALTVGGGLPRVVGDARRLEQVAANLVDNAVKYSPAGRSVEVQAEGGADGAVQFSVTDHGIGLAPEHLERIFEQFYRVDSEQTRAIGGTGLGLAICQRIVAAHGGQITVTSEEGSGSTFTVVLPPNSSSDARQR